MSLVPSPACEALIKGFETCRLTAYLPTPRDRPTIGWGCAAPDIHLGLTWTQAQADARFTRDLDDFAASVNSLIGDAPTSQPQFDAMCSLAYNLGAHAFSTSTVLRDHRAADYAGAASSFKMWDEQAGQVLAGLLRRREAEAALYGGESS